MTPVENVIQNYINEAKSDYVGLWQIAHWFREYDKIESDTNVKEKSLQVARGLIENGIYPGFMSKQNGFDFWQGTPDELIGQIAASWPAKGIPDLGTNHCWFAKRSGFDAEDRNLTHPTPA